MDFDIESGIPIPPRSYGGNAKRNDNSRMGKLRRLAAANVGDSVFFPDVELKNICPSTRVLKQRGHIPESVSFMMRTVDGGVRVWKVGE